MWRAVDILLGLEKSCKSCAQDLQDYSRLIGYLTEAAPTVLVVPTDRDVAGVDVAPPRFEVGARDVERGRRYKMVEDYRVLLAPAEVCDRIHIIIVKKILCQRRAALVQWSINELRRRVQTRGRDFR